MSDSAQFVPTRPRLLPGLAMAAIVGFGFGAAGQSSSGMGSASAYGASQSSTAGGAFTGSLPSGPATNEALHLTLRHATTQDLRYTITSASTASAQQGQVSTNPPSPSTQKSAEVIVQSNPVLTINEAVALAVKGNRQVRSTALGVDAAQQETAALRTSRWPQFQTYLLGGEALRSISFNIPEGALGVYPATGPIPAEQSKVTTPQQFTGLVFAQASQPLSQLWKIHLSLISSKIGEDLARETLRQQRQDTAHSVRDL